MVLVAIAFFVPFITRAAEWKPFAPVARPAVPIVKNAEWVRNPIDAFIAAEHELRNLSPRPEAPKEILLRRVYLDLIGLNPTPEEQRAFSRDGSPDAYERVVERLLNDPRYGERWGRHWMDIWRYSDWAGWSGGNQIRDSKPHIWRWRDWIIESLNEDKGYDRMLVEMLAADEAAPEDPEALRATGYLVRNFKLLSREQWLEDTVKHTSQAFLGLTIGCAKCHDHAYDPIPQTDYYRLRSIFEPHEVRTDRVPGELDIAKDGLVRVYDVGTNRLTYLFVRGDERQPDTNSVMRPGVPKILAVASDWTDAGGDLQVKRIALPEYAAHPDRREFVIRDLIAAAARAVRDAQHRVEEAKRKGTTDNSPADQTKTEAGREDSIRRSELELAVARAKEKSLLSTLRAEELEPNRELDDWQQAARQAVRAQQELAAIEAELKLHLAAVAEREAQAKADRALHRLAEATDKPDAPKTPGAEMKAKEQADKAAKELEVAKKKKAESQAAYEVAQSALMSGPSTEYTPRAAESYPDRSTGRRLAFARWLTDSRNPLTSRVAMNHVWLRHFGRGIVPTPADFGRNGGAPTHPELLDWLSAEFVGANWSFKSIHRLIVTSATYRMASTPDNANAAVDPDNFYLWRMPSRRMEAELVRDNVLFSSEQLDGTMGGPEVDHKQGLTSKRRSVYLRIAAEKEVEFLKIFDGPNVTDCYERRPSVMPHQALALANSELAFAEARRLAQRLSALDGANFIDRVFRRILARSPTAEEFRVCADFLDRKIRAFTGTDPSATVRPVSISARPIRTAVSEDAISRAREHLILVLFNHNDFVTIR